MRSNFDTVKGDLKTAVDEYTQDIFSVADDINEKSYNCIQGSKILLDLKSELADLLDNGGSESDINAKETQIDSHKENMVSSTNTLKEHWAKFDSFTSGGNVVNRFTKIIELSHSLEDIYSEVMQYRNQNERVLRVTQNFSFDYYSGYEILGVFSELFGKIADAAGNLLNIQDFNPGDSYRRQQIMGAQSAFSSSEAEKNAIGANDIFTQNSSTGHYELKKDISPDLVSKYVTYQQHAGYITDLTQKHAERKGALLDFNFYLEKFNGEGMEKIDQITDRYKKSRRHSKDFSNQYDKLDKGYWTGTEEQNNQWNSLYSSINENGGLCDNKIFIGGEKKKAEKRYSLHSQLFPDFYPTFETLNSTLDSAVATLTAINNTMNNDMYPVKQAAYDLLQTLTAGEADYVAALADFEAKSLAFQEINSQYDGEMKTELVLAYDFLQTTLAGDAEYQVAKDDYDAKLLDYNSKLTEYYILEDGPLGSGWLYGLDGGVNGANAILQTTLAGEAEYQAALPEINEPSTPPLFTQTEVDRLIGLHTVYLAAQADFDSKYTAMISFWDNVVIPSDNLKMEAYHRVYGNTNVVPEIPSLLSYHYTYLGAQSDYDSKLAIRGAYFTDVVTPAEVLTNEAYTFLQTLTDEDADYQSALTDWNNKEIAFGEYDRDFKAPATVAANEAHSAFVAHVQGSFDVVGLPMGTYGIPGTTLASFYNEYQGNSQNYSDAVAALETAESELQTLQGQMTRSTPTENDKRDKVKMNSKVQQANLLNMKFEEDYFAGKLKV